MHISNCRNKRHSQQTDTFNVYKTLLFRIVNFEIHKLIIIISSVKYMSIIIIMQSAE